MEEGRKRVLAIVAGILVARHLKNPEDLYDSRLGPRTQTLAASAVQWAERIMRRIDGVFADSTDQRIRSARLTESDELDASTAVSLPTGTIICKDIHLLVL